MKGRYHSGNLSRRRTARRSAPYSTPLRRRKSSPTLDHHGVVVARCRWVDHDVLVVRCRVGHGVVVTRVSGGDDVLVARVGASVTMSLLRA